MLAQARGEARLHNSELPRLASWKSENFAAPRRGDLEFLESERGEARRFSRQIGRFEARRPLHRLALLTSLWLLILNQYSDTSVMPPSMIIFQFRLRGLSFRRRAANPRLPHLHDP